MNELLAKIDYQSTADLCNLLKGFRHAEPDSISYYGSAREIMELLAKSIDSDHAELILYRLDAAGLKGIEFAKKFFEEVFHVAFKSWIVNKLIKQVFHCNLNVIELIKKHREQTRLIKFSCPGIAWPGQTRRGAARCGLARQDSIFLI